MNRDPDEMEVYSWARRHGLFAPADFAIYHAGDWIDPAAFAEAARKWQDSYLRDKRAEMELVMERLRAEMEFIDTELVQNQAREYRK